jgi:hypothetical protein
MVKDFVFLRFFLIGLCGTGIGFAFHHFFTIASGPNNKINGIAFGLSIFRLPLIRDFLSVFAEIIGLRFGEIVHFIHAVKRAATNGSFQDDVLVLPTGTFVLYVQ